MAFRTELEGMDLAFNDEQRVLHDAIVQIVTPHMDIPRSGPTVKPVEFMYADRLDHELAEGEFFSIALIDGCGLLEAAMLVYETARAPLVIEAAGSALIGALLTGEALPRPVAVARMEDLPRAVRFLDRARTLIVDMGDDVAIVSTDGLPIAPVHTMFAYPMGRVLEKVDLSGSRRLGPSAVPRLRHLCRLAIALETAGAMQSAIDFTTQYVKDRRVFGRPVGSFQAVQHRLAADLQKARGCYWLAMRAAWSDVPADAEIATLYAQRAIKAVNYDTHQFNGALGMTLEHALHFWTFRLRILQGELGGARAQATTLAETMWGDPSSVPVPVSR
ncbi:hypothetical protein HGI47_21540 [Novosphingobium sp. ERN07]|uniref:acyl-CoA dehydrogenase family protein n=1 Tax=Novosphingobium sp. ERN07 TaxID=2726187 RepID=UPI0018243AD3|nr:acyl-CoA dehydrogenase family protein [Novosphingobium sp. ERN07]NLR73447.1 hypothetical protein [Novosphingobium sp. ERN07]